MGEFGRWILHEDQKEVFEAFFAGMVFLAFVLLSTLLLLPAGRAWAVWSFAKGYWLFLVVLYLTAAALLLAQRYFRMDLYSHPDAYVISGLAVSGFLQVGWSAFAALTVRGNTAGAPVWAAAALYFVGLLSCYAALVSVGALYMGHIYRLTNAGLALLSYVLFSLWPAAGRALYGWFFDLF